MLTIAHISDPHYGTAHRWGVRPSPSLSSAVAQAFQKLDPILPNLLLVTGDFTCSGSKDDFTLALQDLTQLLDCTQMRGLVDFLFVPGNHDFPWRNPAGEELAHEDRPENYRAFVKAFTAAFTSRTPRSSAHLRLPSHIQQHMETHLIDCVYLEDPLEYQALLVVGLNSMKIDSETKGKASLAGSNSIHSRLSPYTLANSLPCPCALPVPFTITLSLLPTLIETTSPPRPENRHANAQSHLTQGQRLSASRKTRSRSSSMDTSTSLPRRSGVITSSKEPRHCTLWPQEALVRDAQISETSQQTTSTSIKHAQLP